MPPGLLWDDLGPYRPILLLIRLQESLCWAQQALPHLGELPIKCVCLLSQHTRAEFLEGMGKISWGNYQPQAISFCPITGNIFSLQCPLRAALSQLLSPPEVFVPRGIFRTSRAFVLLSLCFAHQYAAKFWSCPLSCSKITCLVFGFSLRRLSNAALLHFPGKH